MRFGWLLALAINFIWLLWPDIISLFQPNFIPLFQPDSMLLILIMINCLLLIIAYTYLYYHDLKPKGIIEFLREDADSQSNLLIILLLLALLLLFSIIFTWSLSFHPSLAYLSMLFILIISIIFTYFVLKEEVEEKGVVLKKSGGIETVLVTDKDGKKVRKSFKDAEKDVRDEIMRGISYWIAISGEEGVQRIISYDGRESRIYLDFVEGKTLREILNEKNKLKEEEACKIVLKIAETLARVLKKHEIVHRDLKPENIVINNDRVVVLDWAFALKLYDKNYKPTGTLGYAPKETVVTEKYDVYSLGVILHECVTGSRYSTGLPSEKIRNLVDRMVCDVERRLSLDEVIGELEKLLGSNSS